MRAANGEEPALRESSTGQLIKQLSEQSALLVRQEIDLARAELTEKGKTAGQGAGLLGGAALLALLALGTLTACLVLLLAEGMDGWLAALIVTVVYAAVGTPLALAGRERLRRSMPPAPEETVETVKEDMQWARTQARSARR